LDNLVPVDVESEVFRELPVDVWETQERRNQKLEATGEKYSRRSFVFFMSSLVYRLSVATVLPKQPL